MKNITKPEFLDKAKEIAAELNGKVEENFEKFLDFVYDFHSIVNEKGGVALCDETTPEQAAIFLKSYIAENFEARKKKIKLDDVKTVPDPAVSVVLEIFGKHNAARLSQMEKDHRSSMAAENKIGQLLEAYIAQALEPQGWFWCSCEILKGVDFFKPGSEIVLLQVKNRDNSENSSSAAIRQTLADRGCPVKIQKWHRTISRSGKTRWNKLNDNESEQPASEEKFHRFIREYEID